MLYLSHGITFDTISHQITHDIICDFSFVRARRLLSCSTRSGNVSLVTCYKYTGLSVTVHFKCIYTVFRKKRGAELLQ